MVNLVQEIAQADAVEIEELLKAVLRRHNELFPDRELSTISLQKSLDKNEQLDRTIAFLQNMKATFQHKREYRGIR